MAQSHVLTGADAAHSAPEVRRIGLSDLADALARGVDDFKAIPSHAVFLCLIYPVIGLALGALTFGYGVEWLLYPLVAGFPLVAPFAAIGLYEMSRRRERGLPTDIGHAFDVFHLPSFGAIAALGLLLTAIFVLWVAVAQSIYVANFGYAPIGSPGEFLRRIFTTPEGHTLIIVGNAVGFFFALAVLMISVVSFPLLLDRDVGAVEAVLTSLRAVRENPIPMAVWGLIVAVLLLLGSLPLLLGLAVVMPVLGHATWHLYRKVVVPDESMHNEMNRPPSRYRRYAAQFPASLFTGEDRR
jgi:uncharacterized membrane protein